MSLSCPKGHKGVTVYADLGHNPQTAVTLMLSLMIFALNLRLPDLPGPLLFLSSSRRVHQKSHDSIIQNVFGKELNVVPTQNEYFAKLQNEWKK